MVGKGQREKVVNADRAVDDSMRDRLHRLRLGHGLGIKFPQCTRPVDRKLGDLELIRRAIDPGFKTLPALKMFNSPASSICSSATLYAKPPRPSSASSSNGGRLCGGLAAARHLQHRVSISRDRQGLAALSGAPSPALERSGCFASTCTLVHADIPATSTGCNNRDMPEGCCVLLFRNARVLPCWPIEPPAGSV